MEKNSTTTIAVIGLVVALIAIIGGFIYIVKDSNEDTRTFSVSGTGKVSADPDEATLLIAIQTNDTTASGAQAQHTKIAADVKQALLDAGIAESDMETAAYSIYPKYEWQEKEQEQKFSGYELSHVIRIKTNDTTHIGKYIDAAVTAGANRIDSVNFELSKEKLKTVQDEAFAKASENAKEKAQKMASQIGVKAGKIVDISTYDNPYPYYYNTANMKFDSAGFAGNSIMPEDVDVSVEVSLTYEFE